MIDDLIIDLSIDASMHWANDRIIGSLIESLPQ